jgi:hypothetical protein
MTTAAQAEVSILQIFLEFLITRSDEFRRRRAVPSPQPRHETTLD